MKNIIPSTIYNDDYYRGMGGKESFFTGKYKNSIYWKAIKIVSKFVKIKDAIVLDAACGRADLLYLMSDNIKKGVGVDYSSAGIKMSKELCKDKSNLLFYQSNLSTYNKSFENKFDIIFMLDVVEHLTPKQLNLALRNMKKYLKKDGVLFVHTFPNAIMNAVSHLLLQILMKDSIGIKTHINCQTRSSLTKIFKKNNYNLVWTDIDCAHNLFEKNIFFRKNWLDRIYNNKKLQKIFKNIPGINEAYCSDIYIIAGH